MFATDQAGGNPGLFFRGRVVLWVFCETFENITSVVLCAQWLNLP